MVITEKHHQVLPLHNRSKAVESVEWFSQQESKREQELGQTDKEQGDGVRRLNSTNARSISAQLDPAVLSLAATLS